jgi:hypothetical protein
MTNAARLTVGIAAVIIGASAISAGLESIAQRTR